MHTHFYVLSENDKVANMHKCTYTHTLIPLIQWSLVCYAESTL